MTGQQEVSRHGDLDDLFGRVAKAARAPGITSGHVHLGSDYLTSNDVDAVALRNSDGTFNWLAYSFGEISMWTLHVGVVQAGEALATGLHVSTTAPESLRAVVDRIGTRHGVRHMSESAKEIQYNRAPPFELHDFLGIARFLSALYVEASAELEQHGLLASSTSERHGT